MTSKPYWCLEMQIDADLENLTTEEEAIKWTNRFLNDLYPLFKRHVAGQSIHVSVKLNHEIIEYEWVDGVDRKDDQQEAADHFVERVRKAQEIINTGEQYASSSGDRPLTK